MSKLLGYPHLTLLNGRDAVASLPHGKPACDLDPMLM
jgi:hypothetical protein